MTDTVTIILATYGRPDALVCAIQSVLLQTHANWRLLVIGDACAEETAVAMAPFLADARIRYVNLPWRCGEQALLNSAGMAVAQSDHVAFLNHDDLWLPSHLELACRRLRESGGDFFMGRSAWTWGAPVGELGFPSLDCISPEPKIFPLFFLAGFHYVEPVSSWVISSALAKRVGPWKCSLELFRSPIQDWGLRAWRAGARLAGSETVTCVKFENQWARGAPDRKYDTDAKPQRVVLDTLRDATRSAQLLEVLELLSHDEKVIGRGMQFDPVPPEHEALAQLLLTPEMAGFYRETGLDAFSWLCAEAGIMRGERWRWALSSRTGEQDISPPELSMVIAHVAEVLGPEGFLYG